MKTTFSIPGRMSFRAFSAHLRLILAACLVALVCSAQASPVIAFNPLIDGQVVPDLSALGGSVTDSNFVPSVTFSIQELDFNGAAGRWWNGTDFQADSILLPATVTGTNWSPAVGTLPALNSGQIYVLIATATNSASEMASAITTVQAPMATLDWDPGLTALGMLVKQSPNNNGGSYWFKISTHSSIFGVWRTALNVLAGEADVYLNLGTPQRAADCAYASHRIGSDGFVLDAAEFIPGQSWYILVNATSHAQWNLVTGDAFVHNLGALAPGAASSTNASIGAEGMIFYQTTVPANTRAWQLWLTGRTNTVYVRKSLAPDPLSYELTQAGQMLVVPPYLAAGTFNGTYFIGVPGDPGTLIQLDSRQQPIALLPFNSLTNVVVGPSDYPYVTFEVQVPVQQIAWQLNLVPSLGSPNLALRRDTVPNEFRNDAFSEPPGGIGASVALVPPPPESGAGVPGLSDGTFYVTIYSTGPFSCSFTNGNPVITDVPYVFSVTNDAPNRVGWRYYRVLNIAEQLSTLGWVLDLANQVPGTEIALRRNAVPGQWGLRYADDNYAIQTEGYIDLSGADGHLEQIGHQADVWYIGIYQPAQPLGPFVLTGSQYVPPPPLIPIPIPVAFDGPGNTASMTNQPAGLWQYFEIHVPSDPYLLGWDLRLTNVTVGSPVMVVCRDILPVTLGTGPWWNQSPPWTYTEWPSTYQWQAGADWTGESLNPDGTPADVSTLAMGVGNPLSPGTYYIGVYSGADPATYTVASQGIALSNYSIPVHTLGFVGSANGTNLPGHEAAYYQVVVPSNSPSWRLKLTPTVGEALLVVQENIVPNIESGGSAAGQAYYGVPLGGFKAQKVGHDHYLLLPQSGQAAIPAGTYYVGVVSQGGNPGSGGGGIGSDTASYVLSSLGPLPVLNLGTVSATDLLITNSLEGGDVAAYRFTIPPGLQNSANRLELSVLLTNLAGDAQYSMTESAFVPAPNPNYYGVDGGYAASWAGTSNLLVNPDPGLYTLQVQSYPSDTSYILHVHLQITGPTPLAFDGPGNSLSMTNQAPGQWQYFQVEVPSDPNLLGWDVRLTNVVAGNPLMVVCRDLLPVSLGTGPWWAQAPPWIYTEWPSTYQWQAGVDWTGDTYNPDGTPADVSTLAMGVGNPLSPGTYFIGVYDANDTSSYTLVSRGIALSNYSIPVHSLGFVGSANGTNLPAREAAYYQVMVPSNSPSWRLKLTPTVGEALLAVQQDIVPNIESGGSADYQVYHGVPIGGFKAQKEGHDHYLLLPPTGQTTIPAGTYYVGVVSEGVNPNYTYGYIGSNTTSYMLSSLGSLPVVNLGTAGATDLLITNSLEGGDVAAYQFAIPPNLVDPTNRVELSVLLYNLAGEAQYSMEEGPYVPAFSRYGGGLYGIDGGDVNYSWVGTSNLLVNPDSGVYTLDVQSYPSDTSYILQIHLQITRPTLLAFDGPGNKVSVTDQPPGQWRFFRVNVPSDLALLGWDVRLTNVTAGNPFTVVCRDIVPVNLGTGPWANNSTPPWAYAAWPSGYQWQAGLDWTGYPNNPDGSAADISTLVMGLGNPLESGSYYIGVYDATYTNSYTLVSRGIALANYSIPVHNLGFVGSATGTNLPPREAAYYQVVVPAKTPSWRVKLAPTVGDALLVVQQTILPNIESGGSAIGQAYYGYPVGGIKMEKAGHQQYLLLPSNGEDVIPAGTYYLGVVSEGVNPAPALSQIGSDTTSYVLSSLGSLPVVNLGTVGAADLVITNALEAEEVAAYQFLSPPNVLGLEVRLENRVGNPLMTLLSSGSGIATPYPDGYGVEGGQSYSWSDPNLITIPNSPAGSYSLVLKASSYLEGACRVRIQQIAPPLFNFTSQFNGNGGTNVVSGILADNERAFFQVVVPDTVDGAPVLGWYLFLSQTNGSPAVRVRQNLLPETTCDTTVFATGSIIIAPPFLNPGLWYVEVKGGGNTAFSLASSAITTNTTRRTPWVMPMFGQPDTVPGLSQPVFGDTGTDASGHPLPGDQGVDLLQGHYDFYAILIPAHNAGLLRTELLAISGNPELYLRAGAAPTVNHFPNGSCCNCPYPVDHQLSGTTTEYGSWVPLNGRTATELTPGLWVLSVYAAGNANVRYRLVLSSGNAATNGLVQELPLDGSLTYTNQQLAGGDWRYYRVQIPTNASRNLVVNWTRSKGSAHLFIRDTVPPGDGALSYKSNPGYALAWASDNKNEGPYPDFASPGSYTLTTPPLRPGTAYYFGFASEDDSVFSITCSTNGGAINVTNILPFYCGSVTGVLPGYSSLFYRLDVPPEATSLRLNAVNSMDLLLSLEQGTFALPGGPAQWTGTVNQSGVNASLSQSLLIPDGWPWLPGYPYYLTITNTSAMAESFSLLSDGRTTATRPLVLKGNYPGDGSFHLLIGGQSGSAYIIQASTDLMTWTSLYTNCASFEFTDTDAPHYPVRFYRTLLAP